MEKLVLYLQRIENSKLTAELHVQVTKGQVFYTVVSNNYDVKTHLNSILDSNYFTALPSILANSRNYVFSVQLANTKQHLLYLYDHLSWRGYKVTDTQIVETKSFIDFIEEQPEALVAKSFVGDYYEQETIRDDYKLLKTYFVTKSVGGAMNFSQYVKTDDKGNRILVRVPPGFFAVNSKAKKILGGGKFLNVNLDDILEGKSDWMLIPAGISDKEKELLGGEKKANSLKQIAYFINEAQKGLPEDPKTKKEKEEYERILKESLENLLERLKTKIPNLSVEELFRRLSLAKKHLETYIADLFAEKAEIIKEESGKEEEKELAKQLENIAAFSPSKGIYTTGFETLRLPNIKDWVYIKDVFSTTSLEKKKNALLDFLEESGIQIRADKNRSYVEFVKAIFDDPKSLENSAILHRFKNEIGHLVLPITVLPVIHGMQIEIPEEFLINDNQLLKNKGNLFGFYVPRSKRVYTINGAEVRNSGAKYAGEYAPEKSVDQSGLIGATGSLQDLFDKAKQKTSPVIRKKVKSYKDPQEFVGTTDAEITYLQNSDDNIYQNQLYRIFFNPVTGKARTNLKEILGQMRAEGLIKQVPAKKLTINGVFELLTEGLFKVRIDLNAIFAKGFKPKPYQLYGALLSMNPKSFRHSGGLTNKLGFNYFWATGVGKTITALLAIELGKYTGVYDGSEKDPKRAQMLRNRPVLIIAPKNLAGNWVEDAKSVFGWEQAVISRDQKTNKSSIQGSGILVIDGKAEERKEIYEYLMELHKSGNFPKNIKAIVVGTQKFSARAGETDDFDEIKNIDLRYVNYLAGPTRYYDAQGNPIEVDHGFFRAVVMDEAGQIMNESSSRAANIYGVVSRVTSDSNRGISINLNAESLANTPEDTVNILRLTDTYGNGLRRLEGMLEGTGKVQIYGDRFLPRTSVLFSDVSQSDVIDLDSYRELFHRDTIDEILDVPASIYPAFAVFDTYAKLHGLSTINRDIEMTVKNPDGKMDTVKFPARFILNNYRPAFISMLQEMHYGALPWKRFLEYGYDVLPSVVDPSQSNPITLERVYKKAKELYMKDSRRVGSTKSLKDYLDAAKRILYREKLKEVAIKTAILSGNEDLIKTLNLSKADIEKYKQKYSSPNQYKFIPLRDRVMMSALDTIKFVKSMYSDKYLDTPKISDQEFYTEYKKIYEKILKAIRFDGTASGKITINGVDVYLPNIDSERTGVDTPEEGEMDVDVEQSLGIATDKEHTGSERKLFIQKRDELLDYGVLLSALHSAGILKLDSQKPLEVQIVPKQGKTSYVPDLQVKIHLENGQILDIKDIKENYRDEISHLYEAISMALDDTLYEGKAFRENMEGFLSGMHRNAVMFDPDKGEIKIIGKKSGKFRFLSIGNSKKYIESMDRLFKGLSSGTYNGAIVGGLSHSTQQNMARVHRNSPISIILGTTDAAGRGLNLNSDDAVIVADYGYETTKQTLGRAFRAGSTDDESSPTNKTRINILYPAGTIDILTFKQLQGAYLELDKVARMISATDPNSQEKIDLEKAMLTIEGLYKEGSDIISQLRSEIYLARYAYHILNSRLQNLVPTVGQQNPSKFDLSQAYNNISQYSAGYASAIATSRVNQFFQVVNTKLRELTQLNPKVAEILKEFFRDL